MTTLTREKSLEDENYNFQLSGWDSEKETESCTYLYSLRNAMRVPSQTLAQSKAPCLKNERIVAKNPPVGLPVPDNKIQNGNWNIVQVREPVMLHFFVVGKVFEDTLLILWTHCAIFSPKNTRSEDYSSTFPRPPASQTEIWIFKNGAFELRATKRAVVGLFQQTMVPTVVATEIETSIGMTEAATSFSRKSDIVARNCNQYQDHRTAVQVTNPNAHTLTISQATIIAKLETPTHLPTKYVRLMTLTPVSLICPTDETTNDNNPLFHNSEAPTTDKRWYPTPETSENPDQLIPIENGMYEILKLCKLEQLDTADADQQNVVLDQLSWEKSELKSEEQAMAERLMVKYRRSSKVS